MDPRPQNGLKALIITILVAVFCCVGISSATLIMFIQQNSDSAEQEQTKEDGVIIAGEYEIRPTTQISDAYKSGDRDSLNDRDKETLDMAVAALNEFLKEGMTDFEKEKAAYDWVTENLSQDTGLLTVIPTSGEDSDNPYGALKYHNAVCVGYATTFRLFMQMLDIPCMVVHENGLYHSWNLVQLDGDYYHVDCYSGANQKGNYQPFNMTDNMCGYNWDRDFFPAANSYKYNLAYMNARPCKDIYKIPGIIKKSMDKQENMVSLKFPKSLTESEAQLANEMCSQIENLFWSTPEYEQTFLSYNWYPVDDGYLYSVYISSYGENSNANITEEQREQASQAVSDAFPDLADISEEEGPYEEDSIEEYYIDDEAVTVKLNP